MLGKAIFKCVAHTVGSSKNIDQEVINILTTDIQFISSFTDTELNNISGLIRDNENFRNNIFEIMRSDEGFKDKVFSSLSTGIKKQYYQFIVENSTGFKIANIHAREKIKGCLLNIPQELIDLLSLTSTDVKNWQDADIEQKPSHELSKEIDLEAKDTDRNELKFFARLDENGNFIMGSMNPENGLLISGLKISSSGIMGIGRFNEEGNLVIDADSQENLFNHFTKSNPKSIEICTKFIEALKRFDLVDAEIGLPIGRDFFFLKELDGRWFLGKKVASSKDVNSSIEGLVLSGNGIKKFSETDNDYSSDYVPVYEDLTPPPPPPPKIKLSINPNNPDYRTSQSGGEDANNPDDRTSQSGSEDISVGCCGLFNRLTKRIRSAKIMPRSITLPRNWRALRNNLSSLRQR